MRGEITLTLSLRPKWWMSHALWAAFIAVRLGIIRDAESAEHWGGIITAEERAAKWLADYAFTVEARPEGMGG